MILLMFLLHAYVSDVDRLCSKHRNIDAHTFTLAF